MLKRLGFSTRRIFLRILAIACAASAAIGLYCMQQTIAQLPRQCAGRVFTEGCREFVLWPSSILALVILAITALILSSFNIASMTKRARYSTVCLTIAMVLGVSWLIMRPILAWQGALVAENSRRTHDTKSLKDLPNESPPDALAQRDGGMQTSGKPPPHPFPEIPRSRHGLPLENDPFVAESVAEQEWLDRNGYPNAKQWEAYSLASDLQLLQAAQAGDSVAEVMLNSRRLTAGDPSAKEELLLASVEGSAFALQMYAAYMAGSGSNGNLQTAYALSRVAEMRGDYRAALGRDAMFSQKMTQMQRMQGDAEAMNTFAGMKKLREELYGSEASWVDPRPYGKE